MKTTNLINLAMMGEFAVAIITIPLAFDILAGTFLFFTNIYLTYCLGSLDKK
jgi:hypothetical protein